MLEDLTNEEYLELREEELREEIREELREELLEEVRGEVLEEGKIIIAKNLLSEGSTPEFVQRNTGLSLDKINELK